MTLQGWAVIAAAPIAAGTFVAEYVGEYLSKAEAERRLAAYDADLQGHALLVRWGARADLRMGGAHGPVQMQA